MRLILAAVTLMLLLNACGHRTMLTLPNAKEAKDAKGKPTPTSQADSSETRDTTQP